MADRAPTLLELAALATAAVAPLLLGVLMTVLLARQADDARPAHARERHIGVKQVAALKTFEHAIVRRDQIRAPVPSADLLLASFPACRRDWDGHPNLPRRLRGLLGPAPDVALAPAARMAVQLDEIDQALARFSSQENRRVTDRVGLDGSRWLAAVAHALSTPVESPDYPGRRFAVQCADIASAVNALARSNARMLDALAWRGTEVDRVVERWRPEQLVEISPRQVARTNPWAGIAGCVYLARGPDTGASTYFVGGTRSADEQLCARADMRPSSAASGAARRVAGEAAPDMAVDDLRWKVPPSLGVMLQPLEALRRPGSVLYRDLTRADAAGARTDGPRPNRVDVAGNALDVGYSVDLTIEPGVQALAQQTAACYTGRTDVCNALGIRRKEEGDRGVGSALLEHAMVRMAAIAVVDVSSGRIEALAGALSPCTRQEYDGPGRASTCDRRLPYPIRYRPDALLNPSVFHDAMPASTIKPIMAAAFLSDALVGARWLKAEQTEIARAPKGVPSAQSLRGQLMRSDSARFLDRMFCGDRGFAPCARPWAIEAEASTFGWNDGCTSPREDCGRRDLLFGESITAPNADRALSLAVPFGRLLAEPLGGKVGAPFRLRAPIAVDTAKVRRCAAGPDGRWGSRDDWEKCAGGVVVDIVAEGWGQGHARASTLGSAGMMATLAAAANGQDHVRRPHLVERLHGVATSGSEGADPLAGWNLGRADAVAIAPEVASVILSGLSYGHRAGTSRLACEQVFEPRACAQIDWIAGKTGTPTFPNDDRSLDELARLCAPGVARSRAERAACGPLRPYKWYVAAYRARPDDTRWTKVIAVLTERNWLAASGRVHGAGDHGPNPAAEIAFQIAGRQVGALAWGGQ